jgi:hypothetical protein
MLEKATSISPDADFAKDAKHVLESVRQDLQREIAGPGEVKMNIIQPQERGSADGRQTVSTPDAVSRAERTATVTSGDTTASAAADDTEDKSSHKSKKKKKTETFVPQPADDSGKTDATADLQDKPSQ